jgi:hypothetical protein
MQTKILPQQELRGRVEHVLVAHQFGSHLSTPVEKLYFVEGYGIKGDNHAGAAFINIRDSEALRHGIPKGMAAFNMRQWSAVSKQEVADIAHEMGNLNIAPGLLGENLIISGIPEFTLMPPGTQLFFESPKGEKRAVILYVTGENKPCQTVGDAIQKDYPEFPSLRAYFIKAAKHKRGLVGIIVGGGFVKEGDLVIAQVPVQRPYWPI